MKRFIILLLLIACQTEISAEQYCETTADCSAAQCCHATEAINNEYAPNCEGIMCSLNCEPDTLDCGQMQIECIENRCSII
jgi:hypothetical protein